MLLHDHKDFILSLCVVPVIFAFIFFVTSWIHCFPYQLLCYHLFVNHSNFIFPSSVCQILGTSNINFNYHCPHLSVNRKSQNRTCVMRVCRIKNLLNRFGHSSYIYIYIYFRAGP